VAHLLDQAWTNSKPVASALAQIARKTGDRMRDLNPALMDQVIGWLRDRDFGAEAEFLTSVKPMAIREESVIFGESLPTGLVLHESE